VYHCTLKYALAWAWNVLTLHRCDFTAFEFVSSATAIGGVSDVLTRVFVYLCVSRCLLAA